MEVVFFSIIFIVYIAGELFNKKYPSGPYFQFCHYLIFVSDNVIINLVIRNIINRGGQYGCAKVFARLY